MACSIAHLNQRPSLALVLLCQRLPWPQSQAFGPAQCGRNPPARAPARGQCHGTRTSPGETHGARGNSLSGLAVQLARECGFRSGQLISAPHRPSHKIQSCTPCCLQFSLCKWICQSTLPTGTASYSSCHSPMKPQSIAKRCISAKFRRLSPSESSEAKMYCIASLRSSVSLHTQIYSMRY